MPCQSQAGIKYFGDSAKDLKERFVSEQQWTDSEGLQFFCRHLIALCVTYRRQGEDSDRFAAYSGTLIMLHNTVFLLTAGHILEDLERARSSEDVEFKTAVLADTFGLNRISNLPIPFDLKGAKFFHINDEEEGLDFGVIALSPYYVRLLSANGVVALQEVNWARQDRVAFNFYAMLGFPEEFVSENVNDAGEGLVYPSMFRVHRLEPPPADTPVTRHPRFVGQIDQELPLNSVKGMSGGPIFGFTVGEETRYWVVALQSTWRPASRIVYGCSLPVLASLMTSWADPQ
jgi:hypothetical protein